MGLQTEAGTGTWETEIRACWGVVGTLGAGDWGGGVDGRMRDLHDTAKAEVKVHGV
jgi:hypothetical protein